MHHIKDMRQPSRRERTPYGIKGVSDCPHFPCKKSHKDTKLFSQYIYSGDLGQIPTGILVSVSPHESQSIVGYALMLFLNPLVSPINPPPPLWTSSSSA